ncbi:CesT family type III secretion system chaperone [Comamonas endophytica]|uniref:CesT family type III secretion system chaperone n=1 Tax=Comamonas endophytica TaxID=2949090 RepID=A0ABY6G963_9BURK|nr:MULTISPECIES: CesT family type III secretion system chaperone [unclassified Acidovorax]MCD2511548.1 CesT family type III secretion system chaperone [Acidovorax sp. D4N7]UYG50932.1 CesT family type III secretion system chaperone [Acidovorax sp. 5MLIR]
MTHPYQNLLTDLAQHIGVDPPSLLAEQELRIDALSIFVQQSGEEEAPDVLLCTVLGELPQPRFAQVARTLLQANHLWVGTGGGTLGLSPEGDTVTWCLRLPLQKLDAQMLAVLLADFAKLGLAWREYLEADEGAAPEAPMQMPSMMFAMRV